MVEHLEDQRPFYEGKHLTVQVSRTGMETVLDELGQGGLEVGRPDRQGRGGF
jgi:hypothetical protein